MNMTVNMISNNIISVELDDCTLIIKYPDINYAYWKGFIPYTNDEDLVIILENLLVELDCTIVYGGMRLMMTNKYMYNVDISDYYYYLLHIENQILYNEYFDKLIQRHIDNVNFEFNNPIIEHISKAKTKAAAKMKISNKFVKQTSTDMFEDKITYIYSNAKTGETIHSHDPNLLEELNSKPKKEKKVKSAGVPITNMTFSFKKK